MEGNRTRAVRKMESAYVIIARIGRWDCEVEKWLSRLRRYLEVGILF